MPKPEKLCDLMARFTKRKPVDTKRTASYAEAKERARKER